MNDPNSFEHVSTRYSRDGDVISIETQFRGKNAFGAMVMQTVNATVDLDGLNILSIK